MMGLFDGRVREKAAQLISALQKQSEVRMDLARGALEKNPNSSVVHYAVAVALSDIAGVIRGMLE